MNKILCLLLLLLLGDGVAAQVAQGETPRYTERFAKAVQTGRTLELAQLLIDVGNSRDASLVPLIRSHWVLIRTAGLTPLAELSLAKLGDTEALQETYCRVESQHPLVWREAIRDIEEIGGWFSIQILATQIDADTRWQKSLRKYRKDIGNDIVLRPPSTTALVVLPKVVPNPPWPSLTPLQAQLPHTQKEFTAWKKWIDENKASLRRLEPTGDGVEFSLNGCRAYRKKEKEWRRQVLK